MTYVLEGNKIINRLNSGQPGVVVAVAEEPDSEAARLLISGANLADRDERLLDQLAETIATRNEG